MRNLRTNSDGTYIYCAHTAMLALAVLLLCHLPIASTRKHLQEVPQKEVKIIKVGKDLRDHLL